MRKYKKLTKDLVTAKGAKAILGCSSRNTVEHYVKAGKIRHIWINDVRLFLKTDCEALS